MMECLVCWELSLVLLGSLGPPISSQLPTPPLLPTPLSDAAICFWFIIITRPETTSFASVLLVLRLAVAEGEASSFTMPPFDFFSLRLSRSFASFPAFQSASSSLATSNTSPPNSSSSPKKSPIAFKFAPSALCEFFPFGCIFLVIKTPLSPLSPSYTSPSLSLSFFLAIISCLSFFFLSPSFSSSSLFISSTSFSIKSICLITSSTNTSAAFLNPTFFSKSSGLTPSTPVNGQRNPFFVNPSRMHVSQHDLPSGSHGKSMAFCTTEWQSPHWRCSGRGVLVSLRA
mmetsp:Transcript_21205/g.43008  ORF Transcript_21205/g.43008 Transcript_21205/m.43008 type:complete len:286 (+) Transcript_21205:1146-2003(+)